MKKTAPKKSTNKKSNIDLNKDIPREERNRLIVMLAEQTAFVCKTTYESAKNTSMISIFPRFIMMIACLADPKIVKFSYTDLLHALMFWDHKSYKFHKNHFAELAKLFGHLMNTEKKEDLSKIATVAKSLLTKKFPKTMIDTYTFKGLSMIKEMCVNAANQKNKKKRIEMMEWPLAFFTALGYGMARNPWQIALPGLLVTSAEDAVKKAVRIENIDNLMESVVATQVIGMMMADTAMNAGATIHGITRQDRSTQEASTNNKNGIKFQTDESVY